MRLILRNKVIWAQTSVAGAKIITFPTFRTAVHAIR